jgi:hypothetical protein
MAKTIERRVEEVVPDGEYAAESPLPSGIPFLGMVRETGAITAGVFPVRPPKQWFVNPRLGKLSGLEIGGDGRVFGHIASWAQSHIGMAGSVKAPKNRSGYAYYRTGLCETSEGEMVEVGQITLTGGHAPLTADVTNAVKHYDDTASAVMDVNIGEDAHGIWVAGALRPEVTDEQLRTLRASSVSGDWRPINGALELVAVCAVNVPGFPIPRALVAGGEPLALVAAGTAELVEAVLFHDAESAEAQVARLEGLSQEELVALAELDLQFGTAVREDELTVDARLERLERQLLGEAAERRRQLDQAVLAAANRIVAAGEFTGAQTRRRTKARAEERAALVAALRDRVGVQSPEEERKAELRARVGITADAAPVGEEERAAELRRRVLGDLTAELVESAAGTEPDDQVDKLEELRSRVLGDTTLWEDGLEIDLSVTEGVAAAARARVQGGLVATATKSWNREKRDKAAQKGQAMSDGSYPIKDKADLKKAIKAIGRGKKSHASIKAHIKKRAKALGATNLLPDDWK